MQHFHIFISVHNQPIIVSGGGAAAVAKLRLLMKTAAQITIFCPQPRDDIHNWAAEVFLILDRRALRAGALAKTEGA